jgi:Lon protease-like protein
MDMADDSGDDTRLPLFPLPDVVCFPRTELKLHVFEPRYRRMVEDLLRLEEDARRIGLVLLKPGWSRAGGAGRPEIFPGGTAGLLMDVEKLPDGGSNILLRGDFRFELRRELEGGEPYRQAVVRPVEEPWLNERDAGIVAVRGAILDYLARLAEEIGEPFQFDPDEMDELMKHCAFEEIVNRVAASFDLPPLRKFQLLTESLPERGLSVLSILRSRAQVLDLLRPYRHLAAGSENN